MIVLSQNSKELTTEAQRHGERTQELFFILPTTQKMRSRAAAMALRQL